MEKALRSSVGAEASSELMGRSHLIRVSVRVRRRLRLRVKVRVRVWVSTPTDPLSSRAT